MEAVQGQEVETQKLNDVETVNPTPPCTLLLCPFSLRHSPYTLFLSLCCLALPKFHCFFYVSSLCSLLMSIPQFSPLNSYFSSYHISLVSPSLLISLIFSCFSCLVSYVHFPYTYSRWRGRDPRGRTKAKKRKAKANEEQGGEKAQEATNEGSAPCRRAKKNLCT